MMDSKCISYFSSINPLARKIIKDQEFIRDAVGEKWNDLDWDQQEQLIDDFMVDISVREKFRDVEKNDSYPKSFPKLRVETGEKIIVDFENDCWTWQDEHSSPFNWRSRSQQDLTLDDLEEDVLSKPPVKAKKKESETTVQQEQLKAPREFSVQTAGSIWESPFLQGMKKPDFLNRSQSGSPHKPVTQSLESAEPRSKTPEEINYAFAGSTDDLSSCTGSHHDERSPSISSVEVLGSTHSNDDDKRKAPRRQRSFSKSPVKSMLSSSREAEESHGSRSLVNARNDEDLAFDNPVVNNEWSSFVNDDNEEATSATPSPYKKLLKEPEPVSMDRGDNISGSNLIGSIGVADDDDEDFKDEILIVNSGDGDQNTSTISKTGFDFLDNW